MEIFDKSITSFNLIKCKVNAKDSSFLSNNAKNVIISLPDTALPID